MTDRMFYKMHSVERDIFLRDHKFYVREAKRRLVSQFSDIDGEATAFNKKAMKGANSESYAEWAHDEAGELYILLDEMKKDVILSIIASLYHRWEKELRKWLFREMGFITRHEKMKDAIWSTSDENLFELFEGFGWDIYSEPYIEKLKICREVVNVYKHGDGRAWNKIKKNHPQYVENLLDSSFEKNGRSEVPDFINHESLIVKESDIDLFADAIISFWENFPENTFFSDEKSTPKWFEKALQKSGCLSTGE